MNFSAMDVTACLSFKHLTVDIKLRNPMFLYENFVCDASKLIRNMC